MARVRAGLFVFLFCGVFPFSVASAGENPWQKVKTPAAGEPLSIGDYSAGCLQGAKALPLDGEGYQVMHPGRLRYFGHPDLVAFIQHLGRAVRKQGLGVVLVGDLSQPRGGRASGGHASHQTGLDVDLWYWYPPKAKQGPLSMQDRERIKARTVVDGKKQAVRARWADHVAKLLRITAEHPRVERVFVHPIIKRELCSRTWDERAWLAKIRPWHGHADHFHVRLGCPASSPDCKPQAPVPAGDGCQELEWWFSEEARTDREKALSRYRSKVVGKRKMPERCSEVLVAPPLE
jgi:penicillin-insensitive murein endopeptidase